MHILVVEDNYDVIQLIQSLLHLDGHVVITARDGVEALQQEATHQPDAIVLDVNLPHIDGYEVCRRIKRRRDVPIMLLTVRAEDAEIALGLSAGADLHLIKPFDIVDFMSQVIRLGQLHQRSWS